MATSIAVGITLWAYSTGWTATVLTPGLSSGASMAVRSDGTVHVAYSAGALHYATNAGGRWTDTLIDANGSRSNGPTASPALTIDAAGTIRVAYKCSDEQARDCIRIATEQGTEWTVETAVTANYLWQPFLAVDTPAFFAALAPAALVFGAHFAWVLRTEVAFEEASIAKSEKKAARIGGVEDPGRVSGSLEW